MLAPFSILVVTRVGVGKVAVNKVPLCTSQDFCNLYAKNINSYYFAYLIQHLLIKKISQGSTIQGISSKEIKKIQLNYPSLEEQNKIASFLNIIESKIKILESKINILKKYKEGLVNQVILPLFKNETLSLNDACKITTGKLDANAMAKDGKYKFFTCSRGDFSINKYAFDCEALLISGNGEVGLSKYYKGKFNAYQRTYVLYDFKIDATFIKLCFDAQINSIIKEETNTSKFFL